MIKKLKQKFPDAVTSKQNKSVDDKYIWIKDEFNQPLGIPKAQLTVEEINLLEILFTSDTSKDRNGSFLKKQWSDHLFHNSDIAPLTSWEYVRFTHFMLTTTDFSYINFEEAFLSLMPHDAILIWKNDFEGVVVEGKDRDNSQRYELTQVALTLESDFYTKVRIFSGNFHSVDLQLIRHYEMETKCFSKARILLPNIKVSSLSDVFTPLILEGRAGIDKEWFAFELLGETIKDIELILTVKTYIECNSNASLAAKKLYIHRNSLQYRIDKFIEKTNLDIRTFQHAMTAYLLILLLDM